MSTAAPRPARDSRGKAYFTPSPRGFQFQTIPEARADLLLEKKESALTTRSWRRRGALTHCAVVQRHLITAVPHLFRVCTMPVAWESAAGSTATCACKQETMAITPAGYYGLICDALGLNHAVGLWRSSRAYAAVRGMCARKILIDLEEGSDSACGWLQYYHRRFITLNTSRSRKDRALFVFNVLQVQYLYARGKETADRDPYGGADGNRTRCSPLGHDQVHKRIRRI
ncbi:hypothetical protein EVG20_g10947 [Dentipellis fragilis]|uniref:Uncharacterized protein n=1 Tax=Dentipellis fragilis TaxID=205917 RepID=A0A4Y9XQB6_9AGAM|nr:hypothetical protein EVG20_g10947 [Dentipellis fragilis]